jgi:beta-glucosidase
VAVPYASLAAANDNPGISDNSDVAGGNFDLGGDSYSAQALAAGTPTPLTPGGQVTVGGTTFTWPDVPAGTNDNVVADGQTVNVSGSGTDLGLLGAGQNGIATGTITVNYTDGTSQSFTLNMADWYSNAAATGDEVVTTTSSWNQSNPSGPHPVSVYFASVPLQAGKTVASVTVPSLPGSFGQTEMHIFAMATGTGTPTVS